MNYEIWIYGPEANISLTDKEVDDIVIFSRFTEAKFEVLKRLILTRHAYQKSIRDIRSLNKSDISRPQVAGEGSK